MTDLKITQLPAATVPLAGTELMEVVQAGANCKLAVAELASSQQPNLYRVGQQGEPFTTIADAITAILGGTAPTAANPAVILVGPGTYTEATHVVPQNVSVVGTLKNTWPATRLVNNSGDAFQPAGFNTFQNLTCVQGTALGTWFVNAQDNTDICVYDCAQFTLTPGQRQGFLAASGANWKRLTLQDCIVNSESPGGGTLEAIVSLVNTSTSARFCDTWIRNCFMDAYQLTSFLTAIFGSGVQDVRVESGNTLRGTAPDFTGVYLAKGAVTSGTPQMEVRHTYVGGGITGGSCSGVFAETGCILNLLNSDAASTVASTGTIVNHNSYAGAPYNALPI